VGELPLLVERGANVRMELVGEVPRKVACADELHDVDEVLGSMCGRHAGRELQLDELLEREHAIGGRLETIGGRNGECDRLRLSVAGEIAHEEEVDLHVGHGVAHGLEAREVLLSDQDVDVLGEPSPAMRRERDRSGDRVGDLQLVEDPSDSRGGVVQLALAHEERVSLVESGSAAKRPSGPRNPWVTTPSRCAVAVLDRRQVTAISASG
jgi:hypothetical protein